MYVAFSGGVDSTVLLDMTCRVWASLDEYRDKPLTVIFADTGNEFMAIRRFVEEFCEICEKRHGIKIDLIKARNKEINFYNIPATVGYPVVSKKVSRMIRDIRAWCREIMAAHQIEGGLTREVFERIIVEYEPEMTHYGLLVYGRRNGIPPQLLAGILQRGLRGYLPVREQQPLYQRTAHGLQTLSFWLPP